MILETDPRLSPWVWMVGAYQQWHVCCFVSTSGLMDALTAYVLDGFSPSFRSVCVPPAKGSRPHLEDC
jgi:hypothetical protein